jgi:GT2 family glycosyltransferase
MIVTCSIVIYNVSDSDLSRLIVNVDILLSANIARIFIIDNSVKKPALLTFDIDRVTYIKSKVNGGYGFGHNLAVNSILDTSDFHFVLNHDVAFQKDDIITLINKINSDPKIGIIMPKITSFEGDLQYLCKLIPTPINLIVRRFDNFLFKRYTTQLNYNYECRFLNYDLEFNSPTLSGCFMLLNVCSLIQVGSFDERFFLYLEDFDLSRRIHEKFKTLYYPQVTIKHSHAKGSYFTFSLFFIHLLSAIKYFNKWGWFNDEMRSSLNEVAKKQIQ